MNIPSTIEGVKLTEEEKNKFFIHGLTRGLVQSRARRGATREEMFAPKIHRNPLINGYELSDEELECIRKNELSMDVVRQRVRNGWSIKTALNKPLRKSKDKEHLLIEYEPLGNRRNYKMTKQEVIKVIGRIKYMNNQEETIHPIVIPLGIKRRVKEYGIDIDSVQEIKVIDLG